MGLKADTHYAITKKSTVNIGGVYFAQNEINPKYVRIKKGNNTNYQVTMKNGVKVEYPQQGTYTSARAPKKPSIYTNAYKQEGTTVNETFVYGLKDAKITGSKGKDVIHSNYQCEQNTFDISTDTFGDELLINEGAKNVAILGKKDTAEIDHKKFYGFGIFRQ